MIIGVTGSFCSGKDTVAEYLISKGFIHCSLSNILREELKKRNMPVTRENLQNLGDQMRNVFGSGILAERFLVKLENDKNYVVTSIRHPDEVLALQRKKEFTLIAVDSLVKMRFNRMKSRPRGESDPKTLEEFKKAEHRESGLVSYGLNLPGVRKMAKIVIVNDKDLPTLHMKVEKLVKDLSKRPKWDDYFIGIMHAVSKRATCSRGRAGALIVKNKQILTTGYVGAPAGLEDCDEVGHLFEQRLNDDGTSSQHCIRTTHAEQNAIVQAAKHGINVNEATIYCKMVPCRDCAKMIINAGIKRVVAENMYQKSELTIKWFKQADVKLDIINKETEKY